VIVSGRGFHPLDDRIYVRDKLAERLTDKTQSCVIEQCFVYCPSELLERGLELIDAPGANDADPFKINVLHKTVTEASNVLCVSKRELEADSAVLGLFQECDVFGKILQPEKAGRSSAKFNFIMFWGANEKEHGMAANNVANSFVQNSPVKESLETGAADLFGGLRKELEYIQENLDGELDDKFEEVLTEQEKKVTCGLMMLWASLCMDEKAAREELDSLAAGRYDFVYKKTNGEALLRALFDIRPKPENVIQQFVKYARSSSYGSCSGKVEIPAATLIKLKQKLDTRQVNGIKARFKERVVDKLWLRLKQAVGDGRHERGRLEAFCEPFTENAKPADISSHMTAFVRNTKKTAARREKLKDAFKEQHLSFGVWSKMFEGWFPKPQSQEVDDFATRLNEMLNTIVIGPPDAPPQEERPHLLVDVEEWLMEEMLLLYGPHGADDKAALRTKLLDVVKNTAKGMLETTAWQPSGKVGWVPKNSLHKLIDRARTTAVKSLCAKAATRIRDFMGGSNWREGYAEAFSKENMEGLVEELKTELQGEARKVMAARVQAAESKAHAGQKNRRQWKQSTFAQKVVLTCATNILNDFDPDPARKKKHDQLMALCTEVEEFVDNEMMPTTEDEEFSDLLKRVMKSGTHESTSKLFRSAGNKQGRRKKRRQDGGGEAS